LTPFLGLFWVIFGIIENIQKMTKTLFFLGEKQILVLNPIFHLKAIVEKS
jgi:hypothetical protein